MWRVIKSDMIKLINKKKEIQIFIDDEKSWIIITPKMYEEDYPSFQIDFNGFDYEHHAETCKDCKELFNDFETDTIDWFLHWNQQEYRLDLSRFGKSRDTNLVERVSGLYHTGTRLKFLISTETRENLQEELEKFLDEENYEYCAFLRDRIEEFDKE